MNNFDIAFAHENYFSEKEIEPNIINDMELLLNFIGQDYISVYGDSYEGYEFIINSLDFEKCFIRFKYDNDYVDVNFDKIINYDLIFNYDHIIYSKNSLKEYLYDVKNRIWNNKSKEEQLLLNLKEQDFQYYGYELDEKEAKLIIDLLENKINTINREPKNHKNNIKNIER